MKDREFQCANCKRLFVAIGRPHEEMVAEQDMMFGECKTEDRVSVCHECWLMIVEWTKTQHPSSLPKSD